MEAHKMAGGAEKVGVAGVGPGKGISDWIILQMQGHKGQGRIRGCLDLAEEARERKKDGYLGNEQEQAPVVVVTSDPTENGKEVWFQIRYE
ncbi:hypothetical protein KFK09_017743 [Dendrobium nobile]|uniref:Uncharacterized protein n=1 Tax=Dendrobium nobile TaxID=94219 RepID=A0A8T3ATA9_DENNO|nr:hypothetical protein KFK09_017743 [Dendrobium nobile]